MGIITISENDKEELFKILSTIYTKASFSITEILGLTEENIVWLDKAASDPNKANELAKFRRKFNG